MSNIKAERQYLIIETSQGHVASHSEDARLRYGERLPSRFPQALATDAWNGGNPRRLIRQIAAAITTLKWMADRAPERVGTSESRVAGCLRSGHACRSPGDWASVLSSCCRENRNRSLIWLRHTDHYETWLADHGIGPNRTVPLHEIINNRPARR